MSNISIEILDYSGMTSSGGGGGGGGGGSANLNDVVTNGVASVGGLSVPNNTTLQYNGSDFFTTFTFDTSNLVLGQVYTLNYEVTSLIDSGTGVTFLVLLSGVSGFAATHTTTTNMQTITWTAASPGNIIFQTIGASSFTISNISISGVTATSLGNTYLGDSIVGELDITDHSDFPLAITLQTSDIKDLTSTSGDYSKTFKIPATKNNNKLLRHPFATTTDSNINVNQNRPCRILVDGFYSLVGLIRVTGVGGYGESPSYYDCVFYGNNLNWADGLSNKYMNEIQWGSDGQGLAYNKANIMSTWNYDSCDSGNSPIVYPITSYGDFNTDGDESTIQLLDTAYDYNYTGSTSKVGYMGYFDNGVSYDTPTPSSDWRPAIFVKDTLNKIFQDLGYFIESSFMETDMFKKLVWLLPNFQYNNSDDRYKEYAIETAFENGETLSTTVWNAGSPSSASDAGIYKAYYGGFVSFDDGNEHYSGSGTKLLNLKASNLDIKLGTSKVDLTNDYITIGEYGFYDIVLDNQQARLASGWKGGTGLKQISQIKVCVNLELKTAGQNSWNIIGRCSDTQSPYQIANNSVSTCNQYNTVITDWGDLSSINIQQHWLNKGDKIRLKTGFKITNTNDNDQNYAINVYHRIKEPNSFNIKFSPKRVEYGQTYDLNRVLDPAHKQIDFVKGIAHAFNLKMTTDSNKKTVLIEPFDTFYKDYAEAIDWTYKLDRSKEATDKWIKTDLKRDIIFKYKTDSSDKHVELRGDKYFDGIKDEYPYQETLPSTFEKGVTTFENPFFAGTYNGKDQDTTGHLSGSGSYGDNPFSGCLWAENTYAENFGRPDKGNNFMPRLLYWNKYSPNAGSYGNKYAKVQTWADYGSYALKWIVPDSSVTVNNLYLSNIYPQATSINRDDTSSPVLSYGNVFVRDYNDATGVYSSYVTGRGLFDTYYHNMFNMLKSKPKLRTAYFDLKAKDIVYLDFTKLIYIDGIYWRINKVVDYQPSKNEPTKVELIEWLQTGTFASQSPSFGSSGTTSDQGGDYGYYGDPAEPSNPNWSF
tara:strand:- start:783 stop:3902 length:3120 start_codon:yes stop_codon:yes gene_type:complete